MTIGEFEQSIINFSKAIEINPKNSDAYGNRAVAYIAIGDDKKSDADKINAIKLGAPIEGINAIIDIVKDKREGSDPFKNLG